MALAPEKWGFFTKSPRDESIVPYTRSTEGSWESAALYPHSEPRNVLGLTKNSRSQGLEVGLLYAQAMGPDWLACNVAESVSQCANEVSDLVQAENPTPIPTLCGAVLLVREVPAPWAYARTGNGAPSREIQKIEVKCSAQ